MNDLVPKSDYPAGYQKWLESVLKEANSFVTSAWRLGDLLNEGERKYGEMYAQVSAHTNLSEHTLANMKYVASRFESSRRRELSFTSHAEVAGLDPDVQDALLDKATENGWKTREIRAAVKEFKSNLKKPEPKTDEQSETIEGRAETPPIDHDADDAETVDIDVTDVEYAPALPSAALQADWFEKALLINLRWLKDPHGVAHELADRDFTSVGGILNLQIFLTGLLEELDKLGIHYPLDDLTNSGALSPHATQPDGDGDESSSPPSSPLIHESERL